MTALSYFSAVALIWIWGSVLTSLAVVLMWAWLYRFIREAATGSPIKVRRLLRVRRVVRIVYGYEAFRRRPISNILDASACGILCLYNITLSNHILAITWGLLTVYYLWRRDDDDDRKRRHRRLLEQVKEVGGRLTIVPVAPQAT